MMQTANGFPLLSPQVTVSGLRWTWWTIWTEKCQAADRCVWKWDIPCISSKIAILIGKMITQKPMDFRWFWGYPLFKTHPKNPRVGYASNFFPMVSLFPFRCPILGLVWGQQLAHPHVSPVHAWRRWLLGWRMWFDTTTGWWFGTIFSVFHILGIIIPTDWYFSEGLKPPTR